jgi:hypothetical protein
LTQAALVDVLATGYRGSLKNVWVVVGLFLAGSGRSAISGCLSGSTRARLVIAWLARDGQSRCAVSPGRRAP